MGSEKESVHIVVEGSNCTFGFPILRSIGARKTEMDVVHAKKVQ